MANAGDYNQEIIDEFRANDGKVGGPFAGMQLLLLHTTGAKSGQRRVNPLAYRRDGDNLLVFGTRGGAPQHPAWYHNLIAHPECELHIGRRGGRFVAREIEGAERDRLFGLAVALYPGYANYARRTDGIRTIRTLRLTSAS